LLKVDAPNVAITACQPLCVSASSDSKPTDSKPTDSKPTDSKPADSKPTYSKPADGASCSYTPDRPADRRVTGFRLRLLETEGKACRAAVRSFRDIGSARQTDFLGRPLGDLVTDKDRLWIDMAPHQWVQVEAWW